MRRIRAFGAFLYDFVVGDDATVALAVVAALGLTAAVAGLGLSAWWVMPTAIVATLAVSVRRAIRHATGEQQLPTAEAWRRTGSPTRHFRRRRSAGRRT